MSSARHIPTPRSALRLGRLVALAVLLVPAPSMAFPFIASQWQGIYQTPAGPCGVASQSMQNVIAGTGSACQMCHRDSTGGEPWNPYGFALRQTGIDFFGVEGLNSDADSTGASNLDEICADTQPGWNADGTNLVFFRDGSTQPANAPVVDGDLDPMNNLSLTIFPPSGSLAITFGFDIGFIVDAAGLSVTGGTATLDDVDMSAGLGSCVVPGTLISGGQTFRCPNLSGAFLGEGTHTLSVTFDLSNGSSVSDTVTWEVIGNTEP